MKAIITEIFQPSTKAKQNHTSLTMFGFTLLELYEKVKERTNLTRREEERLIEAFGEKNKFDM